VQYLLHYACSYCVCTVPLITFINTGKLYNNNKSNALVLVLVGNLTVTLEGGLVNGECVFPGREIASKRKMRENREEAPAYLHGPWEY
jgi:hypothetical protein